MNQTIKYKVTFDKAPEYDAVWEFELTKSGAFDYGNGTCVVITANGYHHDTIDTRYEVGITSNFLKWCNEYMGSYFNPELGPQFKLLEDKSMMPMPGTTTPNWGEKHWGQK